MIQGVRTIERVAQMPRGWRHPHPDPRPSDGRGTTTQRVRFKSKRNSILSGRRYSLSRLTGEGQGEGLLIPHCLGNTPYPFTLETRTLPRRPSSLTDWSRGVQHGGRPGWKCCGSRARTSGRCVAGIRNSSRARRRTTNSLPRPWAFRRLKWASSGGDPFFAREVPRRRIDVTECRSNQQMHCSR